MIEDLRRNLEAAGSPVLVIEDGSAAVRRRTRGLPRRAVRWVIGATAPTAPPVWQGVALLVRDRQSLRRAASALPALGAAARVWCWIEDSGGWAPTIDIRPEWPRVASVNTRTSVASLSDIRFAGPAPVREVLLAVAGGSSVRGRLWRNQPLLVAAPAHAGRWAPASPSTLTGDDPVDLVRREPTVAPDAVLLDERSGSTESVSFPPHPATGRPVTPVPVGRSVPWAELDPGTLAVGSTVRHFDVLSVPPVDEHVINPVGFERDWTGPVARLEASLRHPDSAVIRLPDGPRVIDVEHGLSDSDVRAMRCLQGVELGWRGGHGPQAYARLVAGLAMAGIPITSSVVPRWAEDLLDESLVRELRAPADLGDRLSREERSVRLRRIALREHSAAGWGRRLARQRGLPEPRRPRVSILLATRRPEMVDFALRQVAKQRGSTGEVILATHGFEAPAATAHALDDAPDWNLQIMSQPASTLFGTVLNQAAERATGDILLKMDDDDWYGPDFVADLLQARSYSGADIVGTPAEFIFLTPLWLTVRRPDVTERFNTIVAGGTMMIDRHTFAEVGGFRPVRRSVDAGLLAAVREGGGHVYRTHGLGYLLRRDAAGHTWDPGIGYFLTRSRVSAQWQGFRPSGELVVPDEDRPIRAASTAAA